MLSLMMKSLFNRKLWQLSTWRVWKCAVKVFRWNHNPITLSKCTSIGGVCLPTVFARTPSNKVSSTATCPLPPALLCSGRSRAACGQALPSPCILEGAGELLEVSFKKNPTQVTKHFPVKIISASAIQSLNISLSHNLPPIPQSLLYPSQQSQSLSFVQSRLHDFSLNSRNFRKT